MQDSEPPPVEIGVSPLILAHMSQYKAHFSDSINHFEDVLRWAQDQDTSELRAFLMCDSHLPLIHRLLILSNSGRGVDLLLKSQVFFSAYADQVGFEPFNPANPMKIDKRVLRGKSFPGIGKAALQNSFEQFQ